MYNGYLQIIEQMTIEILKFIGCMVLLLILFYYVIDSNNDNDIHMGTN